MVWETQKPKEPGKSFMSRAISVPLPTPDGPAITRGRTDMGSSAAQQGGAARALLLLLLQGADERTGLGEEEVVCGEGGRWRGEGTWWWRGEDDRGRLFQAPRATVAPGAFLAS